MKSFLTFSDPQPSKKIRLHQKERPTKSMKGKKPLTQFDRHPKKAKLNGKSKVTNHEPRILRNVQVVLERCRIPSH